MGYLYRGYEIISVQEHYKVMCPDGGSWTEDTIEDAKDSIDEIREAEND